MESLDIPPFYVSQEIVANCNYYWISTKGSIISFKKGDEFVVKDIEKSSCECGYIVNIGIKLPIEANNGMYCSICGDIRKEEGGYCKFRADRFSPKIQIGEFISMKQLVEEKLELISSN